MKKQNKDTGAIKKTIDELCTPNGISIGNENTKYTPVNSDKQPIVDGFANWGEWKVSEKLEIQICPEHHHLTETICKVYGGGKEAEANAALIASAPILYRENKELKDLLKWVVNEIETTPDELSDALLGMIKIKSNQLLNRINKQ